MVKYSFMFSIIRQFSGKMFYAAVMKSSSTVSVPLLVRKEREFILLVCNINDPTFTLPCNYVYTQLPSSVSGYHTVLSSTTDTIASAHTDITSAYTEQW